MRNVEVKIKLIKQISAEMVNDLFEDVEDHGIITQTDTYLETNNGRLKIREMDGVCQLIYYNRPNLKVRTSEYDICTIDLATKQMLCRALTTRVVVRKTRQVFIVGKRTRLHLDTVDQLGNFLELEVVLADGESEQNGYAEITSILNRLGLKRGNSIEGSYSDLLCGKIDKSD